MAMSANQVARTRDWNWYHVVLTTSGGWICLGGAVHPPRKMAAALDCRGARIRWVSPNRKRVQLPQEIRAVVGAALRDQLSDLGASVAAIVVARQHVHILACMPQGLAREWTSIAKRYALVMAAVHGWQEKLWGVRSKASPVHGRPHQLQRYLLGNRRQGDWTWSAARVAQVNHAAVASCN